MSTGLMEKAETLEFTQSLLLSDTGPLREDNVHNNTLSTGGKLRPGRAFLICGVQIPTVQPSLLLDPLTSFLESFFFFFLMMKSESG